MAKMKFDGLDKHILFLEGITNDVDRITGKALYEGTKIVADDLKATLNSLPTDNKFARDGQMRKGLRTIEKIGLVNGMGVSKAKHELNKKNISVGFHGYNLIGRPNRIVAGVLENGTSFMKPTHAISRSFRKSKPKAEAKMIEVLDSEIRKIIG